MLRTYMPTSEFSMHGPRESGTFRTPDRIAKRQAPGSFLISPVGETYR